MEICLLVVKTVENYLTTTMNLTARVENRPELKFYGYLLLVVNERLTAELVKETNSSDSISISLQTLGMEPKPTWYILSIFMDVPLYTFCLILLYSIFII